MTYCGGRPTECRECGSTRLRDYLPELPDVVDETLVVGAVVCMDCPAGFIYVRRVPFARAIELLLKFDE